MGQYSNQLSHSSQSFLLWIFSLSLRHVSLGNVSLGEWGIDFSYNFSCLILIQILLMIWHLTVQSFFVLILCLSFFPFMHFIQKFGEIFIYNCKYEVFVTKVKGMISRYYGRLKKHIFKEVWKFKSLIRVPDGGNRMT